MRKVLVGVLCVGLLAPAPASASPVVARFVCFGKVTQLWEPNQRGVVRGTERADVIVVKQRNVIVLGRGGNDRICTLRSAAVWGGAGHDLISTGRGKDHVYGGPGRDYVSGGPGADHLIGGSGADTLVGGGGNDTLAGGGAEDFLFGGDSTDQLFGDRADDLLVGGADADGLRGGDGSDTVSFAYEAGAVQVDLTMQPAPLANGDVLESIENVRGSVFADTIVGTDEGNTIWGDDGDDTIVAGGAGDVVDGGTGADVLDGGDDTDLLSFLEAASGITTDLTAGASIEGDSFTAFENVRGSAHDDEIHGDVSDNLLSGSRGLDLLFGYAGDDILEEAAGGDAGDGIDECLDAAMVDNCESHSHGDRAAYSLVDAGLQGSIQEISSFRALHGSASAGAFGPQPRGAQVALRRMSGSGCYWWDAAHAFMEAWHCDRPIWNDAKLRRDGSWDKAIPSPVQLLNDGRYQVRSRIKQPGYRESSSGIPHNVVDFRLD